MLIFPLKIKRKIINKIWASQRGLSLIEILVALLLVSLVLVISFSNPTRDSRDDLNAAADDIERLISFSVNESILRNSMTRLHFEYKEERFALTIEFGNDAKFVLPNFEELDQKSLSISEREEKEKILEDLNSKFKKITEFEDRSQSLDGDVKIIGVATTLRPQIIYDEQVSVYTYPSGERDGALIIIASFNEALGLIIEPYTGNIRREYVIIDEDLEKEKEYERVREELFRRWAQD